MKKLLVTLLIAALTTSGIISMPAIAKAKSYCTIVKDDEGVVISEVCYNADFNVYHGYSRDYRYGAGGTMMYSPDIKSLISGSSVNSLRDASEVATRCSKSDFAWGHCEQFKLRI